MSLLNAEAAEKGFKEKSLKTQVSDSSKDIIAEEEKEIIRLIKAGNAAISSMALEKFLHQEMGRRRLEFTYE